MLNSARRIVILYAKYGDGHYQAAMALKQRFAEQGIADVTLYDPFGESYPALNRRIQSLYYMSTSRFPRAYGWCYELTNRLQPSSAVSEWAHSLGGAKLMGVLSERMPDAVIQTFPLLTMSHLRKHTGLRIPTYTVLTDYVLHRRWVHPDADRYFVASEELKGDLANAGIPEDRIRVSGIPIRAAFSDPSLNACPDPSASEEADSPPFVLVMAGAYGVSSQVGRMVRSLLASGRYSIRLVCGKNAALEARMKRLFAGEPRVTVYGYIERIERLMKQSSCMITKAGGITLTEAVSLGTPVITYCPIPGQESGNAQYWAGKGKLKIASRIEQLGQLTEEWLETRGTFGREGADPSEDTARHAAEYIVSSIMNDLRAAAPVGAALWKPGKRRWLRARLRTH